LYFPSKSDPAMSDVLCLGARDHAGTWGDGIIDEGPSFALSRPRWDNIDDDELIFYSPELARNSQTELRAGRLKTQLRRALACRVWWSVQALTSISPMRWNQPGLIREIDRAGILQGAHAEDFLAAGAKLAAGWFGKFQHTRLNREPLTRFWHANRGLDEATAQDCKAHEFRLLAILSKCLHAVDAPSHETSGEPRLTLPDLAFAAIHGGVNPAYVFPDHEGLHETMTIACWIGFLFRGRSALLSPEMARQAEFILQPRTSSAGASDVRGLESLIAFHAETVFGAASLKDVAHQCARTHSVGQVTPKARKPAAILMAGARFAQRQRGLYAQSVDSDAPQSAA
jgi:hypothetical protein